jgi:hypothetical protein
MIKIKMPPKSRTIKPEHINTLRHSIGGIYVLKNYYGDILYVGQTESFRKRLRTHARGDGYSAVFSGQIARIDLYIMRDGYEREIYETYMISRLAPKYNRDKVFDDFEEKRCAILEEIEVLEQQRHDIEASLMEYECIDDPYYIDEYYRDFTDEDYANAFMLGEILLSIPARIEAKRLIKEITAKIRYLYGKID